LLIFSEESQEALVYTTNFVFWLSSKKIERKFKANQPILGIEFNVPAFLLWFSDKIKMIFFSIENKRIIFEQWDVYD
jgi:hypothetical protein